MPMVRLQGTDTAFNCAAGDTVLRAALRAGIGMSYSCNVGSCGNCRFELVEGSVTHQRADAPAWTDKDRARGRWLGCQSAPLGDCVVKFRPDPAAVPVHPPLRRTGRLTGASDLCHDIREFRFAVEGPPAFLPGQYALMSLPGVDGPRVYSMSNLGENGEWHFQVRRVPGGAGTTALFDALRPGDAVALDGPYGLAFLRTEVARDIVLIAGGSGLSPMASIARGALRDTGRRIALFFGGRGPADARAADFLRGLDPARLTVTAAVSDPALADGWTGRTGFIHDVAMADLGEGLRDREVYFAGPPAMAQAITRAFHGLGVPRQQIHFDEFY
jgi:toluene monooxygenase electron transfer component